MEIQLNSTWTIGAQIAGGGFARVYEATNESGDIAVAKLIPKEAGADRELLFEPLSHLPNIIPILDFGDLDDCYVLVMPRAQMSLRQHLQSSGPLTFQNALAILLDITTALASLEANVVHRDLKPENILLWDGRWCIADFGIAKYAEAATAADTRKFSMTPPYAAPEQWRGETATHATDIYALGVIAFELITGNRPFTGDDLRTLHLTAVAPPLPSVPSGFAALVAECLLKPANSRPSAKNVIERIRKGLTATSPAIGKLQEANAAETQAKARKAAAALDIETRNQARAELLAAANQTLSGIMDDLRTRITDAAPMAKTRKGGLMALELGRGLLVVDAVESQDHGVLQSSGYSEGFDVIASCRIRVAQAVDTKNWEEREFSLWYCDAVEVRAYRWYELAFINRTTDDPSPFTNPFALSPKHHEAHIALSKTIGNIVLFWAPLAFDQGESEQFLERWIEWFADAASGVLTPWQNSLTRGVGERQFRLLSSQPAE